MFEQNHKMTNTKFYKGSLDTIIFKLLEDNEKMYGYQIAQEIKSLTKGDFNITEGALYPALHRLEKNGHLTTELVNVNNRLRKYYELTSDGKKQKDQSLKEIKKVIQTLNTILFPTPKLHSYERIK